MTRRAVVGKVAASVLLFLGAVGLWVASRVVWARIEAADGLSPMRRFEVTGGEWSPWLTPVALLLLAAIALVWALRGWALRLLAILLAVCAVVTAIPAVSLMTSPLGSDYAARAIDLPQRYRVLVTVPTTWAPWIVLAASLCIAAAAVFALRAARGAGMSSKYQSPAARREELERRVFAEHDRRRRDEARAAETGGAKESTDTDGGERILWDSLDTGVDPTE
ncbi:MAG: TIGR02234 family membrane protein [Gordonia sp. (in: high G+C Gram-positive bacteria)]|uniref:TIGR02234 family membrane protein n=1 Tax=Gordonia sp. (in: high G+C Gram-positive bacteria) TaxID=84139 RepID=UPI0039E488AA